MLYHTFFKQVYTLYFWFISTLAGDINLNPEPFTRMDNNNMQYDFPFLNCNLSIHWTKNQTSVDGDISNSGNKWSIFKNRGMHFIYLNVNSLLPKIEEIRHLAELTKTSVIGISEMKLDRCLEQWNCIEGYDFISLDRSRKECGVACFRKHSIAYYIKQGLIEKKYVDIGNVNTPATRYVLGYYALYRLLALRSRLNINLQ